MIYDFRLTIYDLTDKMQKDFFYWAKRLMFPPLRVKDFKVVNGLNVGGKQAF